MGPALELGELIRAERNADTALLELGELMDQGLGQLRVHYLELARRAREQYRQRGRDAGSPELGLDWAMGDGEGRLAGPPMHPSGPWGA